MYVMYVCMKMVNSKNLKNPRMITTIVESEEYKKLRGNLGGMDFTDWLREQMKQFNESREMEKNLIAPRRDGAISNVLNIIQTTLDKYIPYWIQDYKNPARSSYIQSQMTYDEQVKTVMILSNQYKLWKSRLPKKIIPYAGTKAQDYRTSY